MSRARQFFRVLRWRLNGCPSPPPHIIKQRMILEYASRYKTPVFVETGTLLGDMVEAMKDHFEEVYSIEISPELARNAQNRFAASSHITIVENDSAVALKTLVPALKKPALFWLDGHYSGGNTGKGDKDTPVMEELATIYASSLAHIVLIDDARLFGTDRDYPDMDELESYIRNLRSDTAISTENDCIRLIPGTPG